MDTIGIALALAGALLQEKPAAPPPAAPAAPPPAAAQAPATPGERLTALRKEYDDAQRAFEEKYSAAKTDEERGRVFADDYPSAEKYSERFAALAKEQRGDAVALEAWTWIVQRVQSVAVVEPALAALVADHVESPKLVDVVTSLSPYNPSLAAEGFLRTVLEKSPHWNVKGNATFMLAKILGGQADLAEKLAAKEGGDGKEREGLVDYYGKATVEELATRDPGELRQEAEDLFEDVAKEFKAVKSAQGTLGAQAESELFELRNLAIGRVAPEIVGQDIDGVPFKLSDYRGKVVVLDFWGFW